MSRCFAVIVLYCLGQIECKATSSQSHVRRFPSGFIFGASTSAYQTEGAWDEDGKSENIWDHLIHQNPNPINSSADIANDSYHKYKRDVEIARELGLDYYRFSVSWSRIMPTGFPDRINPAGVRYYNNLINEMLKYNIQPMVTLFHWDLPQKLQEMGGWFNPYMVDWFADFARVAFQQFGDRVKYWNTINEPAFYCTFGYDFGESAPQGRTPGIADYICGKTMLMAHAKAYHVYDQEFRSSQKGYIFIALNAWWYEPESEDHAIAAEEARIMQLSLYAHPIFSENGDFHPLMIERVAAKSAEQGFFRSRLPKLTDDEISYVRGTSDFFGLTHYHTRVVYRNKSLNHQIPSYHDDVGVMEYTKTELSTSAAGKPEMTVRIPWGFYKLLTKIREMYNNPPIFITENGVSTQGGIDDYGRMQYIKEYLNALLDAVEDGSDIKGYTVWSLMDCFEWNLGSTSRFGLYEVDYESPERTRTPRKSAFVYKEIIRTRSLDWSYEPNSTVMTIDAGH